MLQFGRHLEQTGAIQEYYGWGSGGKARCRWAIACMGYVGGG